MPSVDDFAQRVVDEYEGELHETEASLEGERGPETVRYVKRGDRLAVLPEIPEGTVLAPNMLRSLLNRLGIPPEDFGLTLG